MDNNIHEVEFGNSTLTQIEQLYQYDKGQILKITDKVEDGTEVQFSNGNSETTINKAINDSQVEIPDILLQENKKILAYLKIINSDSETTIKTVIIPVKARTKPADYIEPEQEKPFRKYVEEKLENAEKLVAEANDKVKVNEECLKQIDIKTEQSVNQIAEVTNGKIKDLANTTNQQLENINTTAVSQIEAINSSAVAAGESQIKGINTVASSQIGNITNVTSQQLKNINDAATGQIENIEGKTYTQIDAINNTATGQISAINSTALSQIDAINNTTTNQIENMTVKYSDMCRTLGVEHEGIMLAKTSYNDSSIPHDIYSIDVSKFKYIEFGKLVINEGYEDTLPSVNISISLTNLKDDPAPEDVTTGKRYDVSLLNDLQFYVSYIGSGGHKAIVNYKLYNDEDGINGVTDLIVENALGGDY